MKAIVFAERVAVLLAALATGVPASAGTEPSRKNSFQANASRQKADPEPLRTAGYAQTKKSTHDGKANCLDARFRADLAASDLSERAQELRICAELRDLIEGCSVGFASLRSAHDNFESAVVAAGGCR